MSTAPPSLPWFPLPPAGLCSMARRRARPACSRDDTLLRQSWVSAVKRTPLRYPAFQHKGPERAGAFLGNHRQKWQVHYAFPDVFSCELVLCKQVFRTSCSITNLIKRTYDFYLYREKAEVAQDYNLCPRCINRSKRY